MLFISFNVINMYDHEKSYIYEIYKIYPILFVYLLMLYDIIIMIIESYLNQVFNEVRVSFIMLIHKILLFVLDGPVGLIILSQFRLIH